MSAFDEERVRQDLARAADGDAEAFGDVVVELSPWLRSRLRRYVTGPDELDDVVQDTFVRAWERFDRFDPARPFGPWIARIGVNLALDRRRRANVRDEVADAEPHLEAIPVAAEASARAADEDMIAHVDEAMDQLPAEWATTLRLRAVEEMSTKEIAETLGVPLGTVLSRLSRARARLVMHLENRLGRGAVSAHLFDTDPADETEGTP